MKITIYSLVIIFCTAFTFAQSENLSDGIYAQFRTEKGTILCQLEFEKTPMTVGNFVGLAEGLLPELFIFHIIWRLYANYLFCEMFLCSLSLQSHYGIVPKSLFMTD